MTQDEKSASAEIEKGFALLNNGSRDEALEIAMRVLAKYPSSISAQGLRDRIYSDENAESLAKETEMDREQGDESPLVATVMMWLGILCAVGATILVIRFTILGIKMGFNTEVTGHSVLNPGTGKYPVHNYFIYPVTMYIIAGIAFYGYRRYIRNR